MVRTALTVLALLSAPAFADTPLPPPQDFFVEYEGATVTGDVSANLTTIKPFDGAPWSIPLWARWSVLSPDHLSILVLNNGGNLLGSDDPNQIVATVWYQDGAAVRSADFTLSDTMDPADMPRSTSHFIWLKTYRTTDRGWELDLSDGNSITITFR